MNFNYATEKSKLRAIRPGDKHFQIQDQFTVSSRASFEISNDCPVQYMQVIQTCYQNGWLKPVAHITEREYIFMGLSNEHNTK